MSHIRVEVSHLDYAYEPSHPVLTDVSFSAVEQDAVGIIGANGVGKSTLLKLLVGLQTEFSGSIRIEDIPVQQETLRQIRSKVGYVFQDSDSQLFMSDVYDDVAFAPRNYGLPEEEVRRRVEQALELTHIAHLKDKQIYKLSGGEKKLVSIATILSMTPDILLMDEPTIALDPSNRRNLIHILNGFDHLKIIASHDLDFVLDTCGRVLLMDKGCIVCDGAAADILKDAPLLERHGLELPLRYYGRDR